MKNRIIFLDYDGVVNGDRWGYYVPDYGTKLEWTCKYAWPIDNFVNNFEAIDWLNNLYEEYPYDIVVTSTWKEYDNYKECLYNGGLLEEIEILGSISYNGINRDLGIYNWLKENEFDGEYVIFDDEPILYSNNIEDFSLHNRLIITNPEIGISRANIRTAMLSFKSQSYDIL